MAACSYSSSSNSSGQKGPYILYIVIKIVVLIKANAQKNFKKKKIVIMVKNSYYTFINKVSMLFNFLNYMKAKLKKERKKHFLFVVLKA